MCYTHTHIDNFNSTASFYKDLYICIYIYVYICAYIYIYIHISMYTYVYIYLYIYICTYVHRLYIYVYMCVCICVCVYVYIFTYAYITYFAASLHANAYINAYITYLRHRLEICLPLVQRVDGASYSVLKLWMLIIVQRHLPLAYRCMHTK